MIERENIQHIYRWYDDENNDLVCLCWGCGIAQNLDHAETPDQSEELECEDCGVMNEAAALWRVGMFNHNLND